MWSEALGKILTINNLQKQHIIMVDWCIMCKKDRESMNHFLLHCEVACTIWNVFFNRFRLSGVMPRWVVNLFVCWWTADNTQSVVV